MSVDVGSKAPDFTLTSFARLLDGQQGSQRANSLHRLAALFAQRDRLPILVGEGEVRGLRTDVYRH